VQTSGNWPDRAATQLAELEDQIFWDIEATIAAATELEEAAAEHGDTVSLMRARLVRANMWMRSGANLAAAVREMWDVNQWAVENDRPAVLARSHLLLAATFHTIGDPGGCLEHALLAVETLDDTASPYAQIWHRVKLADALAWSGSSDAARERYQQAEKLAIGSGIIRLHMAVLNNSAYAEYVAGVPESAWTVAQRLLRFADEYGYELDPSDLDTIGRIQIENGFFAEAEETMHLCLERDAAGHYEAADAYAEYLLTLAAAQRGLGATARAQATLDESHRLCTERGLADVTVRVLQEQAELFAASGEFAQAFATHKEFFAAYEHLHSLQREAQARTRLAMFETAEARQDAERFREQARLDPLTSLRNRRYVDEHLPALIEDAVLTGVPLAVAILDLDHFKQINDTLSHDVGDQVLVAVARLVEAELATVAPTGFAARLGGEEFMVAMPGLGRDEAAKHLDELRLAVRSHTWEPITRDRQVTVSIGVTGTDVPDVSTQAALMSVADRHLYEAKRAGRDRVVSGSDQKKHRRRYRDARREAGGGSGT
jgi:diguanylate cyclase (GGDEF)-like protein